MSRNSLRQRGIQFKTPSPSARVHLIDRMGTNDDLSAIVGFLIEKRDKDLAKV